MTQLVSYDSANMQKHYKKPLYQAKQPLVNFRANENSKEAQ